MIVLFLRGSSFIYWRGSVVEPEGASRLHQFFVHFSVGVIQTRFRGNVDQTDNAPIIELNARTALKPKNPSANCDPLSGECLDWTYDKILDPSYRGHIWWALNSDRRALRSWTGS